MSKNFYLSHHIDIYSYPYLLLYFVNLLFCILVYALLFLILMYRYVVQLSIAGTLFLLTVPFKISESLHDGWIFPEWMCKTNETILFLNYYASILFLTVRMNKSFYFN